MMKAERLNGLRKKLARIVHMVILRLSSRDSDVRFGILTANVMGISEHLDTTLWQKFTKSKGRQLK